MKTTRQSTPIKFIATNRGLMKCSVAEFDPTKYKGLKQNCGRVSKHGSITTRVKKHTN